MNDRQWIYIAAFVRSVATGMIGVLLGIYLAQLEMTPAMIGVIIGSGLAGAATATLWVTFWADLIGHRKSLLLITGLSTVGAAILALSSQAIVLGLAAFIGMVNGMGRDRGAALVLEQATLPATVPDRERTSAFAKYNVLQDVAHALGALFAVVPSLIQRFAQIEPEEAYRATIGIYAVMCAASALAYLYLSPAIEAPSVRKKREVSEDTKRTLWKISALFGIDSIAGGFLTTALLSFFFYERFEVSAATIGILFFIARILNALSHLGAAWLARRIGLVRTMVFTHIPSSVLLMTVPFMPTFPIAAGLFLLRESLVEMDVPTRQSYVMAVVKPDERTFASGITHLVRLGGWAIAPAAAGLLMWQQSLAAPLFVGATMKIVYDLALWRAFRSVVPPEERADGQQKQLPRG
jgi:MFS family permease